MSINTGVKLIPGVCNGDCLIDWLVTGLCHYTISVWHLLLAILWDMLHTNSVLDDWSIDTFIIYC
jgi:hypothetical protein